MDRCEPVLAATKHSARHPSPHCIPCRGNLPLRPNLRTELVADTFLRKYIESRGERETMDDMVPIFNTRRALP